MKKALLTLIVLVCAGCSVTPPREALWSNWGGYVFTLSNDDLSIEIDLLRQQIKSGDLKRIYAQVSNKSTEVIELSYDSLQLKCSSGKSTFSTYHFSPSQPSWMGARIATGNILEIPNITSKKFQYPNTLLPGESARVLFEPLNGKPTVDESGKYIVTRVPYLGVNKRALDPRWIKEITLGGTLSKKYDQTQFHSNYTKPTEPLYKYNKIPKPKMIIYPW